MNHDKSTLIVTLAAIFILGLALLAEEANKVLANRGTCLQCYVYMWNGSEYKLKRVACRSNERFECPGAPIPTEPVEPTEPEYPTLTPTIFDPYSTPTRTPTPGAYPPPVTEVPYP